MKFKAELRPEEIASTDETLQHLTSVYFDKEKSRLVATNGRMLIVVPCEAEAGDVTGLVPKDAFKSARRRKTKDMGRIRLARKLADDGKALHRRHDGQFPPYEQVIPSFKRGDEGTITFGVNPHYLVALMRAAGCASSTGLVAITIDPKELLGPIRVVAEYGDRDCEMIVMPGRV